tara:strand:+ start:146243 stop:146620 length:378 start_codon:yes stop_codon:yes gene_type:complete
MSAKDHEGNNVLPFKRVEKRVPPSISVISELQELLIIYDHLIVLLRDTCDEGLDMLTDSIVVSVVACREAMSSGLEENTGRKLLKEMKENLRQFPQTVRSMLPGLGPRLCESLERKLGVRFSQYY